MAKPSKKSAPPKKVAKPKAETRNGKSADHKGTKPAPKAAPKPASKPAPKAAAKPEPKPAAKAAKPAEPPVPKISKAEAELTGKILHLISESMAIEEANLTPNATLREDLQIDDIDVAELLMQAEIDFGLNPFTETDWDKCQTVDDFVQLVMKRVEAKRGRRK